MHALGQSLYAVKLRGAIGLAPQGLHYRGGKFNGQGGFQHNHGLAADDLLTRHFDGICGVRIDHIAKLFKSGFDGIQAVGVRAAAAAKTVTAGADFEGDGLRQIKKALALQRRGEQGFGLRPVAPEQIKHKAFEIAGLADVHAGAGSLVSVGAVAHAVYARFKEFVQHIVFIGGHHQFGYGQAHLPRHMAGADIAKIARWHGKRHLLGIAGRGLEVARKVIHHLRQQSCPVDRIDRADFVAAFEVQIVRHRFHNVLAVVKHAFDGDVVDVVIEQAEHLRLLKRTHAPVRAGHEDAHAFFAAHGVFGRAARVATGGAQNVQGFATARQFVFKQIAQQLHGHVFKGQGGAVRQGLDVQIAIQLAQGHDGFCAKHLRGIGFGANGLQIGGRDIVDIERQNLKGQRGVAFFLPS